jgi:uncharacterized protein YecE (DUF72 family)
MLAFYGERLPSVEINATFYRRPSTEQLDAWAAQVPASFQLAFKASRYFSAGPGLKNARVPLAEFFALLSRVKTKLGPVLVQLPQHVKKDVVLLDDFLSAIPAGKRVTLDLVDPSWRCDAVRDALRAHDVALCITESDSAQLDFAATATWGYFRLRKKHYDRRSLDAWSVRLLGAALTDAYVFFKHEDTGPKHALALMKRAEPSAGSLEPPQRP